MMLNLAMFDWITITTWTGELCGDTHFQYSKGAQDLNEKRLQYKGVNMGGIFLGEAMQRGRPHYMIQVSGEQANEFSRLVSQWSPYDYDVTRCDLQVTIPLPPHFSARDLYHDIETWAGPGIKRRPTIVQSGDGLDTVYIGSRTSDRFTRIYVKEIDGGLRALRFEVEYKAEHARRVLLDCLHSEKKKEQILAYEVNSLPALKFGLKSRFLRVLGDTPHKPEIKRVTDQNNTLDWLRETVTPSIERLSNDHDLWYSLHELVSQWTETVNRNTP